MKYVWICLIVTLLIFAAAFATDVALALAFLPREQIAIHGLKIIIMALSSAALFSVSLNTALLTRLLKID